MLPFSLKVAWFILCFIGTMASWIVLYAFWKAVGCWWPLVYYGSAVTALEGTVLLGMIWRMDPFLMPREFCIAQIFLISFSALVITGFCTCFSFATTTTFLLPSQANPTAHSILKWRNVYLVPMLFVPALAATSETIVFVQLDAIQVTDNLHCEIGDPLWIRFLGYSGVSIFLSLPAFILAIVAGARIHKNHKAHRYLVRELYDCDLNNTPSLELSGPYADSPVSRIAFPDNIHTDNKNSVPLASGRIMPEEPPSPASSTFATSIVFAEPGTYPTFSEGIDKAPEDAGCDCHSIVFNQSCSTIPEPELHTAETSGHIVRAQSTKVSQSTPTTKFKRSLFFDIWRLLLFQIGYFIIQVLVILSTLISVIMGRPPPAFGTEHVALLLAAWGPFTIFVHSPSVWKQLRTWL